MMKSEIKVYRFSTGEIQRVQTVRMDGWESLAFQPLRYCDEALSCYSHIYRQFLVPKCPWLFGNMILFHLPEDVATDFSGDLGRFGRVWDPVTAAAAALKKAVRIQGGKPHFRDEKVASFWKALEARGAVTVVSGKLPTTTVIPVGNLPGYMTRQLPDAQLAVNGSFFIMDPFDCATVYDQVGTPLGLCVRNGIVENPPLFGREALIVRRSGSTAITEPKIQDLTLEIRGRTYTPGENAYIYSRPERSHSPLGKGTDLVIIGRRVAAVHRGGFLPIPASGFVLRVEGSCDIQPGDTVTYRGMEDVAFGIQVGNSIVRDGEKTMQFRSRFYNIYGLERVPFPPSLYPLNFEKDRAARIALGADAEGKPVLLWAEGMPKLGYTLGQQSRGASLSDMARFCADAGMINAVNLDGGGSAQILLKGKRHLQISDRSAEDHSEAERPVPLALIIS